MSAAVTKSPGPLRETCRWATSPKSRSIGRAVLRTASIMTETRAEARAMGDLLVRQTFKAAGAARTVGEGHGGAGLRPRVFVCARRASVGAADVFAGGGVDHDALARRHIGRDHD